MALHITRESWLLAAVDLLRPLFLARKHVIPAGVMVSCGFASMGTRSHHVGQCWSTSSSTNGLNQIFISPALHDPVEVLDTLAHELVHAVDDCRNRHGKEFKAVALSLGMKGPMRSSGAGPELRAKLGEIAAVLGPYPHGKLNVAHRKPRSRKPARAQCDACGFQVPMYRRFLAYGAPICPKDRIEMTPIGDSETLTECSV
jgi:hypothetical protein